MIIFKRIADIKKHLNQLKANGIITGFVPTMGALHRGHTSLIEEAKQKAAITISSIFINPTQFNDPKDFEKYPVTLEKDIDMLEKAGCDILFLPTVQEMYPEGLLPNKKYDLGYIETVLDGAYRPGHFQGVCRVVEKLLTIIEPDKIFLGQKDYQQCLVITQLTQIMGISTGVIICPTKREPDGLAMSSRNMRLTPRAREKAPLIYQTLMFIKTHIQQGNISAIKADAHTKLNNAGFIVDYIEIADAQTLALLSEWDGLTPVVVLIAAFNDDIRLIDNLVLQRD